ncbi:diacylglycerol kinase family protein [Actinomyces trachealis]|uniref:diacylglycerol kinase family protein n=1 Tax=Actinomyces trachealis TaxID=2763540 RepID=UPI001892B1A4|nr:diacylglycerol kinase family protein [Actinomyces trachealis]
MRRPRLEAALAGLSLLGFIAVTALVLLSVLPRQDTNAGTVLFTPRSTVGQVAEALSLLTHPLVILTAIIVAAVLSFKQRMRRLAVALTLTAAGIPLQLVIAAAIHRPRPQSHFADSISSYLPGSFPNGHITAVLLGSWVLVTLTRAHRRPQASVLGRILAAFGAVALTGLVQWATGMARPSDLLGGVLLGSAVVNLGLFVGGVETILSGWAHFGLPDKSVDKRAAVILNPTKVADLSLLRRRVEAEVLRAGWEPTHWLETTPQDAGAGAAQRALDEGVDLVMVVGGDGTVRSVCTTLAGTGTAVALVPAGTGNLLARNLAIPLDTDSALRLALSGQTRAIDVVRLHAENENGRTIKESFVVMAGMGLDARIMEDTDDDLKKVIRSGAYAVAAVSNAVPKPFKATVTLDDGPEQEQEIVMALLGNVGTITGGMTLFPQASPDDGQVDLLLASPSRVIDWARLGAQILTGRELEGFTLASARHAVIEAAEPVPFEVDGDTAGKVRRLEVRVEPGVLQVVAPPR